MKKIIMIMLSAMLVFSTFFGGCSTTIADGATDKVLRIYNWDEYIDEN